MVVGLSQPTKELSHHMCLPIKIEPTDSPGPPARSILGIGALMMLACLAGPALAGAIGALGAGVLLGAGGVIFALAACAAVPTVAIIFRRRSARRTRPNIAGAGDSARG